MSVTPIRQRRPIPVGDTISALSLLPTLWEEVERAKALSDRAYERAAEDTATAVDIGRWRELSTHYQQTVEAYKREQARVDAMTRDLTASEWEAETDAWRQKLLDRYGSYGEQYRILCTVIAPLVVRVEKANAGALRLTPGEMNDLTRTLNSLIAQLQKHTESTKTQSESLTRGAMIVLRVVDRQAGNQPHLLERIYKDAKREIERASIVDAEALALPSGNSDA